jgi:hypothetical protein
MQALLSDVLSSRGESTTFYVKQFRHQDTKTQRFIVTNSFALCLGALMATFPVLSGLVICELFVSGFSRFGYYRNFSFNSSNPFVHDLLCPEDVGVVLHFLYIILKNFVSIKYKKYG